MFEFLSFGAGVNSTAALLLSRPGTLIFADTGDEHPSTYSYIQAYIRPFVASYGGQFIVVRNEGRYARLQDQAFAEHIIPVRVNRWCTDKWKVRPIREYLRRNFLLPCEQVIAIDAGEAHRARPSNYSAITNRFPLVELDIDREACRRVIEEHGWPVPPKSGCFYCPFQPKSGWIALKRENPALFQVAVQMERNGSKYGELFLASNRPLEDYLKTGRIRESGDEPHPALPCVCYDGQLKLDLPLLSPAEVPPSALAKSQRDIDGFDNLAASVTASGRQPNCFLCAPDAELVYYSDDSALALCGLGPVVRGYSVVATRKHVRSAADAAPAQAAGLASLASNVRRKLAAQFGSCLVTEHGRVAVCLDVSGTSEPHCYHAHFLLFPTVQSVEERARPYFAEVKVASSLQEALRVARGYDEYYLLSPDPSRFLIMARPGRIMRQFSRYLVAETLGHTELADWRRHPRREESVSSAAELRKLFAEQG